MLTSWCRHPLGTRWSLRKTTNGLGVLPSASCSSVARAPRARLSSASCSSVRLSSASSSSVRLSSASRSSVPPCPGGAAAVGLREALALGCGRPWLVLRRWCPRALRTLCQCVHRVLPTPPPLRWRSLAQAVLLAVPQLRHSERRPRRPERVPSAAAVVVVVVVAVEAPLPIAIDPCGPREDRRRPREGAS